MTDASTVHVSYQLKTIANPKRLRIFVTLCQQPSLNVSALRDKLQIEQSLLSHSLIIMKDRGILDSRRQGKEIYYSIRKPAIAEFIGLLLASVKSNAHSR